MNRLLASYLVLSGLALAGSYRPAYWPLLAAAHFGVAAALLRWHPAATGSGSAAARWLGALYPLLIMPLLYAELPLLNHALHGGSYFDETVLRWERSVFGFEPARELAARWASAWLSETLHAAYVSYYLIIYAPPLLIGWRRGHAALREVVFTLSLVFFAHYLFFVWFPVEGPRYRFPTPVAADARGPMHALANALLAAGSSRGAAFPSSHVGVSVAATLLCWRALRPAAPIVALLTIGLALGAVYGGYHYGIDVLAGALFGVVLFAAARPAKRRLEPDFAP